ncbi:hypothetical protein O59_000731 [Cellvibrio sp. BR]|uniref:acyltransferase family protein n=1 Tax=Cellvibrio sp. BR TaxID=1134474 RepID=UPI000260136A|nr:acyltransferase [Cellvibrio sp. BR]EIK46710.1 hypothetical protein O59_000731 [Cellvibrio sp. BR]
MEKNQAPSLSAQDSEYVNYLKGASILRVVLVHLGLSWAYLPYSSYIGIFLPVLFFCSGFICISLFLKRKTTKAYLIKALIGCVTPFYLIYILSLAVKSTFAEVDLSVEHLFRVILLSPSSDQMPYPLGQIWYLRVLLFCLILSPLIFTISANKHYLILIPAITGLALSSFQFFIPFGKELNFFGHSFFQELVYSSYFFIGAYCFLIDWRKKLRGITYLFGICILGLLAIISLTNTSNNLSDHAYYPDIYYFLFGLVGVLLCLLSANIVQPLISHLSLLKVILNYFARHSYGIFLIHSLLIVATEEFFGWKDIGENWHIALFKIATVVIGSMLLAYPITLTSKKIGSLIFNAVKA